MVPDTVQFCSECGTHVGDERFCPNCGHLYHRYRDPQKSTVPARGKIWCCKRCGPVLGRLAWREVASPRGDAAGVAEEQKGTRG